MIKRYRSLLTIPILLSLSSCVIEDEGAPGPTDVFVKYYGEEGIHRVSDMLVNSSDDIVIFGTQQTSEADALQTLYLLQSDSVGNQIGESVVINPGAESILDTAVVSNAGDIHEINNGYLIVSTCFFTDGSGFGNSFIFWAQLGDDLNLLNENSWDTISAPAVPSQNRSMLASEIIQTSDGNVIIAGGTYQAQPNDAYASGQLQNLIVKKEMTDEAATIWRRSDGRPNHSDQLVSITELSSGELLCVGITSRQGSEGEGGTNVTFQQYNAEGLSQVDLAIRAGMTIEGSNNSNDLPNGVITFSGGVKVVGTSTLGSVKRAFVMTFQGSQLIRELIVPANPEQNITGNGITPTRQGDLLIAGTNENVQNGDVYMVRTSGTGVVRTQYEESTFGIGSGADLAKVAVTLPTGSLLIGADMDFGSGQVMIGLIKINDRVELQRQ